MKNLFHFHTRIFLFFFLVLQILLIGCTSNTKSSAEEKLSKGNVTDSINISKGLPKFEFTKEIHKFGVISEGEIAVCDFFYKNIGSKDLIISNVETSCGCTAVEWDKKPLATGEESHVTVQFDSKGRYGKQYKVITIFCNTMSGSKELVITAQVN